MRRLPIAIAASVLLTGCGDSKNPAGPGQPNGGFTVTIVAQEGLLFLGETYTFTMNARSSSGDVTTTGGTWGSDAPAVATVEAASGRVQIVGIGEATIFVDYQGARGTRRIRTTVNYAGTLNGTFRVTACAQSGVFADEKVCAEVPNGTVLGFRGTFSQSGETVTATMDLGDFPADPVTATVDSAGELRFQSEHREGPLVVTGEWALRPSGSRQVAGTVVLRLRVIGVSGTSTLRGDILPATVARLMDSSHTALPPRTLRDVLGLGRQ